MVFLNLKTLLEENKKSKYWLVQKLESNYTVINKMLNNETSAIYFETIDRLCKIFDCTPNDLFVITNEERTSCKQDAVKKEIG